MQSSSSPLESLVPATDGSKADPPSKLQELATYVFDSEELVSVIASHSDLATKIALTNVSATCRQICLPLLLEGREELSFAIKSESIGIAAKYGCGAAFRVLASNWPRYISASPSCGYGEAIKNLESAIQGNSIKCLYLALMILELSLRRLNNKYNIGFADGLSDCLIKVAKSGSMPKLRFIIHKLPVYVVRMALEAGQVLANDENEENSVMFERILSCMPRETKEELFLKEDVGLRYPETETERPFSQPLLFLAVSNQNKSLFDILVKHGCNLCLKNSKEWNLLHYAAVYSPANSVFDVEQLVGGGADIHAHLPQSGKTPLHMAAMGRNVKLLDALIAAGADPRVVARPVQGFLPLSTTARPQLQLLSAGIGWGALQEAELGNHESAGYIEIPSALIKGLLPIEIAAVKGCIPALRRLGQAMLADGKGSVFGGRYEALKYCMLNQRSDIVNVMLDLGINIDLVDDAGQGAMHWAAATGNPRMIKIAAEAGANPNLRALDGSTPLDLIQELYSEADPTQAAEVMEGMQLIMHYSSKEG